VSVPDPYKVLQVDPEAEDEVIEAAYRRLARKYHPDVAPGPESQDRMVRINQAWEMLKAPTRRAAVDRARARAQAAAATVAATEAKTRTASEGRSVPGPEPAPRSAFRGPEAAGPAPSWPSGVTDPIPGGTGSATRGGAPDWTPGRSTSGSGYDAPARSAESAGPPPGNPSGTTLTFGRYAGWSLGEISRSDLEYLEWLDRTPIGRAYQTEIDALLRARGRRVAGPRPEARERGLFRRR
jgi:curved DNA-binding protein CbpA